MARKNPKKTGRTVLEKRKLKRAKRAEREQRQRKHERIAVVDGR